LARIIVAPSRVRSSGSSPFTLPSVPTGMNCGVCTSPCGVRRPRARVAVGAVHVETEAGVSFSDATPTGLAPRLGSSTKAQSDARRSELVAIIA
jgi:hypothetical protein